MIEISAVRKSFGGVEALKGVDLTIRAGEIHALLGENGAGKSTLMKIISGALAKDSGQIKLEGKVVDFESTEEAKKYGIGIIYQEFSLVPELSVAENIFLHKLKDRLFIHWKELFRKSEERISGLGFRLDVRKKVKYLSVAQQQVVEIAKALSEKVKVMILDEPSAVLGPDDVHKLFSVLRKLKEKGVAIVYISHHLDEIFELTDRITVLKDGATVGTVLTAGTDKDQLVNMMLGRPLKALFPDRKRAGLKTEKTKTFKISDIKLLDSHETVGLEIRSGEIVGVGGLVGSGRTELLRAIFGADPQAAKVILCQGKELRVASPKDGVTAGVGMVPEDRKQHGGLLKLSIRENISLVNYVPISSRLGFIQRDKEAETVDHLRQLLNIKMSSSEQALGSLSGGNQQKVVLAKWLNIDVDLLLIDEPTRGVDIGAKAEIYQILHTLAGRGLAILMVSSDWEELIGLPDRVLIMRKGTIAGEIGRQDLSEEKLLRMAIGHQKI